MASEGGDRLPATGGIAIRPGRGRSVALRVYRGIVPWAVRDHFRFYRERRRLGRSSPDCPPILVYQMGKVGSSTVRQTLFALGLPNQIIHVHFMEESHIEDIKRAAYARPPAPYVWRSWDHGRRLGAIVKRLAAVQRCLMVTLVRDPIARAVSSIFEVPELAFRSVQDERGRVVIERCVGAIEAKAESPGGFLYPEVWFRREPRALLGIDILALPFDRAAGYQVLHVGHLTILVLRTEGMSTALGRGLGELLGLARPVAVESVNVRGKTREGAAYNEVKRRITLPKRWLRKFYDQPFIHHFYTDEMIQRFVKKWSKT